MTVGTDVHPFNQMDFMKKSAWVSFKFQRLFAKYATDAFSYTGFQTTIVCTFVRVPSRPLSVVVGRSSLFFSYF